MIDTKAWISNHPVLTYYLLAFATSWTALLLVVGGPTAIPGDPAQVVRLMPRAVLALIAGPAMTGLVLTGVISGRTGLRELGARLLRWRVGARWYALALLIAPLSTAGILLALSLRSPQFVPPVVTADNKTSLLLLAIGTLLLGGVLEELGWTGFAIPRLRQRHGVVSTGVIAGLLWEAWHVPMNVWYSGGATGDLSLTVFVPLYLLAATGQLVAYRVLMVWVYDRTESLLVATFMHGSLIASTAMPILVPPTKGSAFLTWFFASAVALWLVVIVVAIANRWHRRSDFATP